MSPICSKSYLFFFLAVLKLVAYFLPYVTNFSRFMPHVRFPTGGGLAQIFRFPASSERFGHFSREFTYEVTATATASSITVALGQAVLKLEDMFTRFLTRL